MFLSDNGSYKTYLDLKNYLYNNNCTDIELNYFYFPFIFAFPYKVNSMPYLDWPENHFTKYMEKDYTNREYGYSVTHTIFMESLMSVLKNYINGKENLIDIDNSCKLFLNNIEWSKLFGSNMTKEMFNNTLNNIPKADLYLISSRLGIKSTASLSVELALALYLIRKYGSKVFIGGGAINEPKNIVVNLINSIGKEYTNGKLEYLVGTIGINIYNYIKGYEYQNKRSPIERNVIELNISPYIINEYLDNKFTIELVRGCTQHCSFCCNHIINQYDNVDISVYNKWFQYLNTNYPNTIIQLYAPEINTNEEYFNSVIDFLLENNIRNPISFYLNITKLKNSQIEKLNKLNIFEISCSLDMLYDNNINKRYSKEMFNTLDNLIGLINNKKSFFEIVIVANTPLYKRCDYSTYKNVFMKYHNYITYNEFMIYIVTPYFYNPSPYGIEYLYYKNRYNELSAINNIINRIPVMYFRKDLNRKELINMKYEILRCMKEYMLYGATFGFTNLSFLNMLVKSIYPDLDLIETKNIIIDKTIDKIIKNMFNKV